MGLRGDTRISLTLIIPVNSSNRSTWSARSAWPARPHCKWANLPASHIPRNPTNLRLLVPQSRRHWLRSRTGTSRPPQWAYRDTLSSGSRIVQEPSKCSALQRFRSLFEALRESNEMSFRPNFNYLSLSSARQQPPLKTIRTRSVPSLSLDNLGVPAEVVAIKVSYLSLPRPAS